jgi:hypothetical protein
MLQNDYEELCLISHKCHDRLKFVHETHKNQINN